jgi:hypothetical protein
MFSDGTQQFDCVAVPYEQLKNQASNVRMKSHIHIVNDDKPKEAVTPSKLLRPSGRLSHLNRNHTSEYQDELLPGVGNLHDPRLEQEIGNDRAASTIQSAYRGYTVRKSLHPNEPQVKSIREKPNERVCHFIMCISLLHTCSRINHLSL